MTGDQQPSDTTTVEDELALVIGAMLVVGMSPNKIAHWLVRSGWRNPELPYLDDMPQTRDAPEIGR